MAKKKKAKAKKKKPIGAYVFGGLTQKAARAANKRKRMLDKI